MRNNIFIGALLIALISCWGCEDKDLLTISEDIPQNEMQDLSKAEYVLTLDEADLTFETFSWTAPDYGFPASINYTVQADVSGNNFASAFDVVSASHETSASINVVDFNKLMIEAELEPETPYVLEFRVASVINPDVETVYSSVKSGTVTAYATEFPPIYMIGAATGGWDTDLAVIMYTTGAPKEYSITNEWTSGEAFRFFSEPSWEPAKQWNWTYFEGGTIAPELENAEDGDTNLRFTGESGFYTIVVNLATKTITMVAVEAPRMLMVGAAMPGGWDIDNPTEMTYSNLTGAYEATVAFANETFRFFTKNDWSTGLNYPYFLGEGYAIPDLFEDALDGDNNFRFIGTPGTFKCTLNMWEKTITMEAMK